MIFQNAPPVLIERILGRAQAEGRSDDNQNVITPLLHDFEEVTRPLVDYYRSRGLPHTVDASWNMRDVTKDILSACSVSAGAAGHRR